MKPLKLTRAQIKEGLKQTPIEQILLGAGNPAKVNLTSKQKAFARKVADGLPKAETYRTTYNTKAKKQYQGHQAHMLSKNPKIAQMIEAFTLANSAREYLLPEQLRTLTIQKLVEIATSAEAKHSSQLKALELIGKLNDVQLFSERKEHIHLHSSIDLKGKLLESLRVAFQSSRSINDIAKRKAQSLLIELEDAQTIEADPPTIAETATPPTPTHPNFSDSEVGAMHTIPHNQSDSVPISSNLTITPVIVTNPLESSTSVSIGVNPHSFKDDSEGVGGIKNSQSNSKESIENTPLINLEQNVEKNIWKFLTSTQTYLRQMV